MLHCTNIQCIYAIYIYRNVQRNIVTIVIQHSCVYWPNYESIVIAFVVQCPDGALNFKFRMAQYSFTVGV